METVNKISTELSVVDRLGLVLAQIADLEKEADAIKTVLKESGEAVVEGSFYKASVILSNRSTIDNKAVYKALNVSDDLLAKFTRTTPVATVKVTARQEADMCDEYTDDATDKIIKLTEQEYNDIWFEIGRAHV